MRQRRMTPEIVFGLFAAHLVGDYVLQSHWMAVEKVKHWWPALVHGAVYTLPFLFVTQSIPALLVIALTHTVIDRYRLAKYVGWAKNQLGPKSSRPSFSEAMANGGYSATTPVWLSSFLLFVADNTIHLLVNAAAVVWL
jgi:Protein of unknown function (DUF3307)